MKTAPDFSAKPPILLAGAIGAISHQPVVMAIDGLAEILHRNAKYEFFAMILLAGGFTVLVLAGVIVGLRRAIKYCAN